MDKNEKNNRIPEFLKEIFEGKTKHVDTPSEKITKLAIERDVTYDRIQNYKKKIEADLKSGEDTSFTEMQVKQLEIYKNMLGDQIKKLIDET